MELNLFLRKYFKLVLFRTIMLKETDKKKEEEQLIMIMNNAKEKIEEAGEIDLTDFVGELAGANNQLGEFYEGIGNKRKAENQYDLAMQNYEKAIKLASKNGKESSKHIYTELHRNSKKALTRVTNSKEIKIAREISATGSLTLSAFGLSAGLALLSPTLTGNAIGKLSIGMTSYLGTGLLILGLIAGFFWFKYRN